MGECNPACMKIIINSGLVAETSDLLVTTLPEGHRLAKPARDLSAAAHALVHARDLLVDNGALTVATRAGAKWDGCDDAELVMTIVREYSYDVFNVEAAAVSLENLRDKILGQLHALVGGTLS